MKPFLKWPGGKRWLVNTLINEITFRGDTYYEPFLGSGALFFALLPEKAVISDINPDLINLYTVMRDNPLELQELMITHQTKHNKEYYYSIRSRFYSDSIQQAARFLYLNRTCYNGMYRVNKQGQFNVPIGTKENCIYDIGEFQSYSKALEKAELVAADFASIIHQAHRGDLIFADPPYASANRKTDNFVKYNDHLFNWEDQIRLHHELVAARDRGAMIYLTNVDCQEIQTLYRNDGFCIRPLLRSSNIGGKKAIRSKVYELLITS